MPLYQRGAMLHTLLLLPTGSELTTDKQTHTHTSFFLPPENFLYSSSQKCVRTIWVRLEHTVRTTTVDLKGRQKDTKSGTQVTLYVWFNMCLIIHTTRLKEIEKPLTESERRF